MGLQKVVELLSSRRGRPGSLKGISVSASAPLPLTALVRSGALSARPCDVLRSFRSDGFRASTRARRQRCRARRLWGPGAVRARSGGSATGQALKSRLRSSCSVSAGAWQRFQSFFGSSFGSHPS